MRKCFLPSIALLSLFFFSCSNSSETLELETPDSYVLSQVGKYITYRLDSLVFPAAGRRQEIHSYQEKHLVDAVVTDASGRTALRVYRYLRDTAGIQGWTSSGSYLVVPTRTTIETVEDNLRIINIASPVKQGTVWKGNVFLKTQPYSALYNFSNDDDMSTWDFNITGHNETISVNGKTYNEVITVLRIDESDVPDTINVSGNTLNITSTASTIWLRGTATDTIKLTAPAPVKGNRLTLYNRTNRAISLNNIPVPVNFGMTYQYSNGNWRYPDGIDTLYSDLPFAFRNYGIDKYAKNIGLIYQELFLWEFQPNTGGTPFKVGFGIKRSILEHN